MSDIDVRLRLGLPMSELVPPSCPLWIQNHTFLHLYIYKLFRFLYFKLGY